MNFSPEKLFLVGIIALVVLGPNRLPQAARTLGRMMVEFRRVSATVQSEFSQALAEPREAMQKSVGEFGLPDVRSQLRSTISDVMNPASAPAPSGSTASSDGAAGEVGSPIVDPSRAVTSGMLGDAGTAERSEPRGLPVAPDDPSFN